MDVIEVFAVPHNREKIGKGVTALGQTGFIGRQIAGVEVRNTAGTAGERAELASTRQVVRRIDLYLSGERAVGRHQKIGVALRRIFDAGIERVPPVAVALRVDNVASEAYECPVFPGEIQWNGRDCKALLNFGLVVVALIGARLRGSKERYSWQEWRLRLRKQPVGF